MSIEDPLTPEELAKINRPYFEKEAREMEKRLNRTEEKVAPIENMESLTTEELEEIIKKYFEMEKREIEKNKEN